MRRSTMRASTGRRLTLLLALLSLACAAQAADLAGVKLPDTMEVGGECLPLNGMALGKKFIFKVYVVALYLPAPAKADEAVVEPDVPKGFVMQFLRSVKKEKLVQAFKDGFEKNAGPRVDNAQVQIDRFLAFVRDVKKGDRVTFTYEPGKGSTVTLADETQCFEGKDFADVFLLLYVGPKPPGEEVKKALLGQP
jgi:hypothetical protein